MIKHIVLPNYMVYNLDDGSWSTGFSQSHNKVGLLTNNGVVLNKDSIFLYDTNDSVIELAKVLYRRDNANAK